MEAAASCGLPKADTPSRSAGVGATPSYGSPSRPQGGADNELGRALSEKIKKALREQPNGVNIKDKFDRMDTLREGRLDRTSLRRGLLNELRVNLSPGEVDQVLGFVDTSREVEQCMPVWANRTTWILDRT